MNFTKIIYLKWDEYFEGVWMTFLYLFSGISSDNGGSSSSSTSSEEGICGTNVAKKQLFTNGCSSDGALSNGVQNHVVIKQRTSPRKAEETSKNNAVVVKDKGPKKK